MIGTGDSLNPPMVSVPSGAAVQLIVSSGDGRGHRVLVRTQPAHSLTVPAGGHASILLTGLQDGRYVLVIDGGVGGGSLVVGVQPGP